MCVGVCVRVNEMFVCVFMCLQYTLIIKYVKTYGLYQIKQNNIAVKYLCNTETRGEFEQYIRDRNW